MTVLKIQNCGDRSRSVVTRAEESVTEGNTRDFFGGDGTVLCLDCGTGYLYLN